MTNTNTKITKRDNYKTLIAIVEASDREDKEQLIEFLNKEIRLLINRADKERERAAKKKVDGDELREKVEKLIGEDWITPDDIVAALDETEVTRNKVIARVSQLIKIGKVEKGSAKINDRKVVVYRLAGTIDEDVADTTDAE